MKKLFFTFGLFVVSLAFGQMETVKFDRKLVYEQDVASSKESKRSVREVGVLEYYHSSSYGMLRVKPRMEDFPYSIGSYYMLFGKKFPFWAMIDAVDRTIAMNPRNIEEVIIKVGFTKTNKKGKVGGVSCNYYEGALVEKGKVVMEVCVDETSSFDNFSKVFGGNTKKGLILSAAIEEGNDKIIINLTKNEPLNLSMALDTKQIAMGFAEKEAMEKVEKEAEARGEEEHDCSAIDASEEGYAVDPLLDVYNTNAYKNNGLDNDYLFHQITAFRSNEEDYTSGEGRKKTIALLKLNYKSILKNHLKTKHISKEEYKKLMKFFQEYVKEVEAFDPEKAPKIEEATEVRALEPEEFEAEAREFPKYSSAYKTMHMEKKPNLALDDALRSENLKQAIPQFCSDIYGQVSVFENEELQKQLLHFMGQTCDLYLYPKVDNVYYDGTLDALRRSILEIEKLRPSLSKKDLKNLRTLIENLD